MFANKEVAEYYDTTQNHYEQWWKLKSNLSLHYGIWDEGISNFKEALRNTNKVLMESANIQSTDKVLDAGCGVGGAAFFVHENTGAQVTGISLSQQQVDFANTVSKEKGLEDRVNFEVADFTNTNFPSESFDVIWACESVCHASEKADFIKECHRLLKKGGRLVMFDFFLSSKDQNDPKNWIHKWVVTWAVPALDATKEFEDKLNQAGFSDVNKWDYTSKVQKSARRMYLASLMGAIPSITYNLLHPKVSRFAKTHYLCGYYQYKALKANLWKYNLFLARK